MTDEEYDATIDEFDRAEEERLGRSMESILLARRKNTTQEVVS